ncbi:MAG: hypothetical protein MJ198_09750 [Bacteroidales bacterium]|nr:hypothetical protein [Bacteroidales bacterium]
MNTLRLFIFFTLLSIGKGFCQEFTWKGAYDFIADNREFTTYYGYPETILCSRLSGAIGYQIDTNQAIFGGGSYMIEHGEKMFAHEPVLSFYYQYTNNFLNIQLGSFPIEKATFPKVLYTDSLLYYRPNYQGARAIFNHKRGEQTLLFDWHTQVNAGYCEKFITGFSGITHFKNFFITDMFYYRHHAEGERGKKSVADNGGWGINLGYNIKDTWFDSLSLSTGFVNTWYANKKDTTINSPLRSIASYSTFYIQKKCLAIDATYYYGEGTHLPWGDPLYRCGNYARIDGILYILKQSNVDASFRFCFHYLDGVLDNSQQIYLRANIGGKMKK